MRLLLDTHIFLWFITGDRRLPSSVCDAVRDLSNEVYLSAVSLWEATVKYQLGRLPLPEPPDVLLPDQRRKHQIATLPLDEASVSKLASLPRLHRDPFDRMLICQALAHNLTLVTIDDAVLAYPIHVLGRPQGE